MKYEISINIKDETDSLVVQEAADNQLHELYPEPRKNKNAIRNIRDALALLLPSPDAFFTRSHVGVMVIDDVAEEDEDGNETRSLSDFLDAMVAIAGEFVSIKTLS